MPYSDLDKDKYPAWKLLIVLPLFFVTVGFFLFLALFGFFVQLVTEAIEFISIRRRKK